MAFPGTVGDRKMEDLNYRSFPVHDTPNFTTYSPLRLGQNTAISNSTDARATLQRRFTTDSMKDSFNPRAVYETSGLQRLPIAESLDLAPSISFQKFQAITRENEQIQENKRRMQEQLERMEIQERQNEIEIRRIAQELTRDPIQTSNGHSEPTTPPEFKDGVFSDRRIRSGFMSTNLLATPPSVSRHDSSAHQLMTPPAEDILPIFGQQQQKTPSKSVPASRRNSDENQFVNQQDETNLGQRLANARIPNSTVPRTAVHHNNDSSAAMLNMLFDEQAERNATSQSNQTSTSPGFTGYLQMSNSSGDQFPILVRRDSFPSILSASSAALDLAVQKKMTESQQTTWSTPGFARHRPAQHSLPVNNYPYSPTSNASPKVSASQNESPVSLRRFERSSAEVSHSAFSENHKLITGDNQTGLHHMMPKLQSSFSTSDIPNLRHNSTGNLMRGNVERHRRELSNGIDVNQTVSNTLPFGPPVSGNMAPLQQVLTPPGVSPLPSPGLYGPYVGVANPIFHAAPFGAYPVVPATKVNETMQPRAQPKRAHEGEPNRYAATNLMDHVNEIYSLCKDQHGCRYLQKKLEEKNPQHVQMIFQETHAHVVELMTDPFGNYLCQKLLEYATDEQRTVLVNNAAPQLVKIALNQHGTRALQKMIEFLSTPAQIQIIVNALKSKVVELIQDLNGNHVIQKCLNRLSAEDSQFIFDAVGENCVPVGTHRHGCCVLQRCIDHASGPQKVQLIAQITAHAFQLVQDPFGNYVVQYILDQEEAKLSEQLINRFTGSVCQLSKQKFSSNVIEKCIRVAEPATKKKFIEEMINPLELEKLIRDSYANYVIQTALDYADIPTRQQMVDNIRPILPAIRMTPYGRRIQSKIQVATGPQPTTPTYSTSSGSQPRAHNPTNTRSSSFSSGIQPPQVRHTTPGQQYSNQQFRSDLGPAFTFA